MSETPAKSALQDPVVADTSKALDGHFAATLEALRKDVRTLMAANGQTPTSQAVSEFADQMIALLAARVRETFPSR